MVSKKLQKAELPSNIAMLRQQRIERRRCTIFSAIPGTGPVLMSQTLGGFYFDRNTKIQCVFKRGNMKLMENRI
jgi:hypothetical protein